VIVVFGCFLLTVDVQPRMDNAKNVCSSESVCDMYGVKMSEMNKVLSSKLFTAGWRHYSSFLRTKRRCENSDAVTHNLAARYW